MNNRPLFWAVMCFALGEVLYIIAGKGNQIGTALAVLICVAIFAFKLNISKAKKCVYILMLIFGFCRIWWEDYCFVGNQLFGRGEYIQVEKDYGQYRVSFLQGQIYQEEENDVKKYLNSYVNVSGVGIVEDISTSNKGYNITVKLRYSQTSDISIEKDYKIIIYGTDEAFYIGQSIAINGEIFDFVPTGNPGEFNRKNYYKARGIVGYGTGNGVELVELEEKLHIGWLEKILYGLKDKLYRFRELLDETLKCISSEDSAGLYGGILLGEKKGIPDDDMLLYRLMGIAHIFAISGLHIGIVGGLLYKLLRKIGLKFMPSAVVAMLVTLLYGIMTGFSFSTIRAVVMLGLSLGGEILGRRYDMLTGMGLALGVLLMVSPFRIMDGGLILSFGAVAGVAVSKYIIKILESWESFRQLQKKKNKWLYGIISSFIFSVGIGISTTPLIAYMYFQVPLYSVLINMLIVPLMSVTVFCGLFGVLIGIISPFFGGIIIFPGIISLKLYEFLCRIIQRLPMDVINTGKPNVLELVIYYALVLVLLVGVNPKLISWLRTIIHKRTRKWIPYKTLSFVRYLVLLILLVVGVGGVCFIRLDNVGEKVVFLDVGQGDGTLITTDNGTNIVIDVGSTSNDSIGEYVAYPGILVENMGSVDYWFISHCDRDHTSGLEYILNSDIDMGITIKNLVVSENSRLFKESDIVARAREKGINVIYMSKGDYLSDGSFVIRAIHPDKTFLEEDINEQSLVLSYQSKSVSILFTGDIGEAAIKSMLELKVINEDFDVLKVPHHGSKYSYSMLFLETLNHQVSIVSCGRRNSYGHPHSQMLEGLINVGSDVYRTDYQGAIRIIVE